MKKVLLFSGLLLLFACNKDDLAGTGSNVNLTTQQQVDDFSFSSVGMLFIGSETPTNITDLSALSRLKSASILSIRNNPQLRSLNGLQNLKEVEKLIVGQNETLNDISALSNIQSGLEDLDIHLCPALSNVGGIKMSDTPDRIKLSETGIHNLNTFSNVRSVQILMLDSLVNLSSVSGLSNLEAVNGAFVLRDLPNLTSFSGFEQLQAFPQGMGFINVGVTNFEGFNNITSSKRINITECQNLESLSGFDSLETIDGPFSISNCPNLVNSGNFPNLTSIGHYLVLENLMKLENLDGFSNLTSMQGLLLENLSQLEDVSGLSNWNNNDLYENGSITLRRLPSLTSLNGINVEEIFSLEVKYAFNLTSLQGLEQLRKVNRLTLFNVGISDLSGLTNLTNVHATSIERCAFLVNLDGTNLTADIEGGNQAPTVIYIKHNGNLSDFCGLTQYATSMPNAHLQVSTYANQYNPVKAQLRSETECSQ